MNDQSIPPGEGILHHAEGIDLIPANIELAGLEAVSYTHLDVYKRQPWKRVNFLRFS